MSIQDDRDSDQSNGTEETPPPRGDESKSPRVVEDARSTSHVDSHPFSDAEEEHGQAVEAGDIEHQGVQPMDGVEAPEYIAQRGEDEHIFDQPAESMHVDDFQNGLEPIHGDLDEQELETLEMDELMEEVPKDADLLEFQVGGSREGPPEQVDELEDELMKEPRTNEVAVGLLPAYDGLSIPDQEMPSDVIHGW